MSSYEMIDDNTSRSPPRSRRPSLRSASSYETTATTNDDGNTPLHHAVMDGHNLLVESLLIQGANPNDQNVHGDTPLHLIDANDKFVQNDMAFNLLTHDANPNIQDKRGFTFFHIFARDFDISSYYGPKILDTLMDVNADINIRNNYGETPLHFALSNNFEMVKALLMKGANPFIKNDEDMSPIDIMIDEKSVQKLQFILEHSGPIYTNQIFELLKKNKQIYLKNNDLQMIGFLFRNNIFTKDELYNYYRQLKERLTIAGVIGDIPMIEYVLERRVVPQYDILEIVSKYNLSSNKNAILKLLKKHLLLKEQEKIKLLKVPEFQEKPWASSSYSSLQSILNMPDRVTFDDISSDFDTRYIFNSSFALFEYILPNSCVIAKEVQVRKIRQKYENGNLRKIFMKKDIFDFDNIFNKIYDSIKSCDKRFVIIPVAFLFKTGNSHANSLIIDRHRKTIERFEPHGYFQKKLISLFDTFMSKELKKINYTYIYPLDYCPIVGPQKSHANVSTIGDPGFCVGWSWWYILHRISYPDINQEKLIKALTIKLHSKEGGYDKYIFNLGYFLKKLTLKYTKCDKVISILEWVIDSKDQSLIGKLLNSRILEEPNPRNNIFYVCSISKQNNKCINYIKNLFEKNNITIPQRTSERLMSNIIIQSQHS